MIDASATLPEVADRSSVAVAADVDGDGDIDVFAGNLGAADRLLLNDGTGVLTESSGHLPLGPRSTTHAQFADLDLDGDQDLWLTTATRVHVLENDGNGRFRDVTPPVLAAATGVDQIAFGDVDGDDDLDVLLATQAVAPGLLRVLANLDRHLGFAHPARVGKRIDFELSGSSNAPWLLATSPARASASLPPLGTLRLAPVGLIVAGQGSLDASGDAVMSLVLPAQRSLIGLVLHWQALVGTPLRFTNAGTTRVSGL